MPEDMHRTTFVVLPNGCSRRPVYAGPEPEPRCWEHPVSAFPPSNRPQGSTARGDVKVSGSTPREGALRELNEIAPGIVGASADMSRLGELTRRFALRKAPILIRGESGTGKGLVAKAIHALGRKASGPFVAVNCGRLDGTMLESELFGHARGAFTGATTARPGLLRSACGGTLFLDEIGDLPRSGQVALLRVIEEHEVRPVGSDRTCRADFRLVAATHRDLDQLAHSGEFRADLLFRLSVLSIHVPCLRDRRPDIPLLVEHWARAQPESITVTAAALDALLHRGWPGNVRELLATLERAAALCSHGRITVADLDMRPDPAVEAQTTATTSRRDASRIQAGWRVVQQRPRISEAALARELGVPRATWRSLLKRNHLSTEDLRELERPPRTQP